MVSVDNTMTEQMLMLLWWDAAFGNIFSKSDPKYDVEDVQCPDVSSCSDKQTCCLHMNDG